MILVRQSEDGTPALSQALVKAVDRLADLPAHIADRLADEIRGIWVGPGAVPDLDGLGYLHGVPLNPERPRATWDLVAGAWIEGLIVISSAPSASYDVTLHEVGHALDQIDRMSERAEFAALHEMVRPVLASSFYRDRAAELFAEGFALVASDYPVGLVAMMSGERGTRRGTLGVLPSALPDREAQVRITKLLDGRLRVPLAAARDYWVADGTETIGPEDARYAEYLPLALTEDEREAREREAAAINAQLLVRWGASYDAQGQRRTA